MGNFTGILAEMETIIGTVATLKLVSERGGTEVVIPKNPTEKCLIAQIIGVDAAKKLKMRRARIDRTRRNVYAKITVRERARHKRGP